MREHIVVDHDPSTGPRLKYYGRTPDAAYWTARWEAMSGVSYERERRGHLPHQLRSTFTRWVAAGARTLEAGCGLGHFTVAVDALGYRAEGLDWSGPTIERLRRQFSWIPWHVADVRRLPFPDDAFDAVYSPGVCEHFEEGPVDALVEAHRVLRPGGIAVVSTPCFNRWLERHASRLSAGSGPKSSAFYQYAFTPSGMAGLLATLGFDVLQIRPYGALATFERYGGWRIPHTVSPALAFGMDYVPVLRDCGSACIWVARKR
ncbi:MAG: class I SAM-dependent methyltransferase [Betaproteobacteria bacterium]